MALFGWLIKIFDASLNLLLRALRIEPVHDVEHSATARDLVLFAYHHQHDLGGAEDTPLDIQQFLTTHIDGFVRGYRSVG